MYNGASIVSHRLISMNRLKSIIKHRPETLFYVTVGFLVLSYVLVIAIDVFNVFDLHTRWTAGGERHYFWKHWFQTPVEIPTQWVCLSVLMVTLFLSAGAAYQRGHGDEFEFSMLFGIGVSLMLIEDSLNPRHLLRHQLRDQGFANYGTVITLTELAYFALLGGLLVFVFIYFRHVFWKREKVRKYLIRGYVFYAIAVGSSWSGPAFRTASEDFPDLYTVTGRFFTRILFFDGGEREAYFQSVNEGLERTNVHLLEYWFMDRVWEESFELLGASALLVAGLAFFFGSTSSEGSEDSDGEGSDSGGKSRGDRVA